MNTGGFVSNCTHKQINYVYNVMYMVIRAFCIGYCKMLVAIYQSTNKRRLAQNYLILIHA